MKFSKIFFFIFCLFLSTGFSKTKISKKNNFLVFQISNTSNSKQSPLSGYVCLMQEQANGKVKILSKYPTKYGMKGANKQYLHDKKTPTGRYIIRSVETRSMSNNTSYLKFGGYSIPLNYPNIHDQRKKRTGSSITIHGGRNKNTLGCPRVLDGTMNNPKMGTKNIKKVAQFVQAGTPVLILENCPSYLLGKSGAVLSYASSKFWKSVVNQNISREELKRKVKAFKKSNYGIRITTSSILNDNDNYSCWNLTDGVSSTAWVSKQNDDNKWVKYKYPTAINLNTVYIETGYNKRMNGINRWQQNSRPTKAKLVFSNGTSQVIRIKDIQGVQKIPIRAVKASSVQLIILDYKKGGKYPKDVCISELYFE